MPHRVAVNLADYALFWPGTVLSVVLAIALSGPVARHLRRPRAVGFGLILSLGVIVSATLTPSYDALAYGIPGSGSCDFSHVLPTSVGELFRFNDVSLNILLYAPLGFVLGWAGNRRQVAVLLLAAMALPFAIEATQMVVTPLGRACQAADVVENLSGLALGLIVAAVAASVRRLTSNRAADGQTDESAAL
jgi:hypothetical protein